MAFWNKKSEDSPSNSSTAPSPAPAAAPAPAPAPQQAAAQPAAPTPAAAQASTAQPQQQTQQKGQPSLNSQLAASLGKIVSIMMFSERFQNMTLKDLVATVLPPLTTNQFVVAEARPQGKDVTAPIGLLLWAKLSNELDQKFSTDASIATNLVGRDWNSGENLWIIETVGPPNVIEAMVKQLVEGPFAGHKFKFRARGSDDSHRVEVFDPAATQQ